MLRVLVLAFAVLACNTTLAAERVYRDYSAAYRAAEQSKRYLLVSVGFDGPVPYSNQYVYCRLPAGAKEASHPTLKDLEGSGVFVVDFQNERHRAQVVSILPSAHCTPQKLIAAMSLPAGSLTQRTLIWAVRVHPEKPKSTDCECAAELMAHADRHSQAQADSNRQYHNLPTSIANSEIVAESWPWNKNIVTAAIDLVHSWRQSPGHWRELAGQHRRFGMDMRCNGTKWFGTGVFKD